MLHPVLTQFLPPLVATLLWPYAPQSGNPQVGSSQQTGPASHWILAQFASPGFAQTANTNITGTSIAGAFQGDGSALTGLDAGALASGTVDNARLPINLARLDAVQTFKSVNEFLEAPHFAAPGAPFTVDSNVKVSNLNADRLDGLDSSAFLQSLPNPLVMINGNPGSTALWGETSAANGTGVTGTSSSTSQFGIGVGASSNYGPGMRAISYGGPFPALEAYGNVNGNGITAYGGQNGVEGHSSGTSSSGVSGYCTSSNGSGVRGEGFVGVEGYNYAANGAGIYGYGGGTNGYGVLSVGRAYVLGDLAVTGSKLGYVVDLVKNGDFVALEPGDVVEIAGYEPAIVGDIPVTIVRRATSARASAVLGPIDCAVAIDPVLASTTASPAAGLEPNPHSPEVATARSPRRASGSIAPGEYGNVVTLGAFRAIRVDSSFGVIRAGDLLVASPNAGYAMLDSDPRVGTVIGKALADWSGGAGEIPVMVSSR